MNYTQSQLLSLSGMTLDRLRHWRKDIPALNDRAGRGGTLCFEDIALVAVLSHAVDVLGIALSVFAPHYDDLLAAFQDNPDVGEKQIVLWLDGSSATVGHEERPPSADVIAMVRIAPVLKRVVEELRRPAGGQFRFELDGTADRQRSVFGRRG